MPSQKTEEKLINVVAIRKFAIDYSPEELKKMQSNDNEKRSHVGLTKMIEVGDSTKVTKEVAEKLQDAGALKIKL